MAELTGHIDVEYLRTLTKNIKEREQKIINSKECIIETNVTKIDNEAVVNYLNKYLYYVVMGKPFIIEITDLNKTGYLFHTKTRGLKDDTFSSFKRQFLAWLESPQRRSVSDIVYKPYLKVPTHNLTDDFNIFKGFKWTMNGYDNNFVIDNKLIEPWIDLLRNNWCSDNDKLFNYIIKWFASKVQYPYKKVDSSLVITSLLEGIGKNTFFEFFNKNVIGDEFGIVVGSIDELLSGFNDHFEKALIICCDELKSSKGAFGYADALKKLTTQTTRNIHTKFMAQRLNCPDYSNYVFFTNNFGVIKPSMSDRRYFCIEASNNRAGNFEYWNDLYKYKNDNVGQHFFYYLATMDLTDYDSKKIPMTEWKRELKEFSINTIVKSVINYIKHYKGDEETRRLFLYKEFYNEYKLIMNNKDFKTNNRGFAVHLKKMFNVETIRRQINTKTNIGFMSSILELKNKVKSIIKDTDYSFEDDNEDDTDDDETDTDEVIEDDETL